MDWFLISAIVLSGEAKSFGDEKARKEGCLISEMGREKEPHNNFVPLPHRREKILVGTAMEKGHQRVVEC